MIFSERVSDHPTFHGEELWRFFERLKTKPST
jgi:hypothetical protein